MDKRSHDREPRSDQYTFLPPVERTEIPPEREETSDVGHLHSGLAQTALPHTRPKDDSKPYVRKAGDTVLIIDPGTVYDDETGEAKKVGVPFGPKARLSMIYLQSEAMRCQSREISMGRSMSAWMRSLGFQVSGGQRGSIQPMKEQLLRIARCNLTLRHSADGLETYRDSKFVSGLQMWAEEANSGAASRTAWPETVMLSEEFFASLQANAVNLDKSAIAALSSNSLGLDLYAYLAFQLPRLHEAELVTWKTLSDHLGSNNKTLYSFGQHVRRTLPNVLKQYDSARVEIDRKGLVLKPSQAAVPEPLLGWTPGLKIIGGNEESDR